VVILESDIGENWPREFYLYVMDPEEEHGQVLKYYIDIAHEM